MLNRRLAELGGLALVVLALALGVALASWSAADPSINNATHGAIRNLLGFGGAMASDVLMQTFGLGSIGMLLPIGVWGWRLMTHRAVSREKLRLAAWVFGTGAASGFASCFSAPAQWPLPMGLGGVVGDALIVLPGLFLPMITGFPFAVLAVVFGFLTLTVSLVACGFGFAEKPAEDEEAAVDDGYGFNDEEEEDRGSAFMGMLAHWWYTLRFAVGRLMRGRRPLRPAEERRFGVRDLLTRLDDDGESDTRPFEPVYGTAKSMDPPIHAAAPHESTPAQRAAAPRVAAPRMAPRVEEEDEDEGAYEDDYDDLPAPEPVSPKASKLLKPARVAPAAAAPKPGRRIVQEAQPSLLGPEGYELPPLALLAAPKAVKNTTISPEALEQNARLLEGVLEDFGVKGQIINVRPGPVVTLYELEPAPGIKSSRVIGLADDIARSMSAISARVAVVPGRNVIGIELPNAKRETVYLRELLASEDFEKAKMRLPLCLGKTIGGEPVIAELARMPHLLIAGTTGSGKSVAINTMILSLLYRLKPEECRLIMIDPKMLELSVYDGIPHLLAPVVTDPKKAVVALKWAVREMEERYRKMSKVGVRNIEGFNARIAQSKAKGEALYRTVQTGFDRETGEAIYEREEMDLEPLPFVVVIVDEMADLMIVAGKEIEGAIQRLAQMARAAGIHIIMATQRPSVDVITGTIKANFPTRISFQVTSKIDSRTILGEQGAEQLLGQGDMLYMAGGGRISRVHGPFCSDEEVEKVVAHLKSQGAPDYLDAVTQDDESEEGGGEDGAVFDKGAFGDAGSDLYDQAVKIVLRDKKCSTSYIQRRLQIGYNRAASLVERMEKEGLVGPANHAGKREILVADDRAAEAY